jgi:MFS family permease
MLRNRSILGLLTAELASLTGSAMTFVALPWFVLTTTGSTARMGWVLAAELAPIGLLGIPSGSLAARLGARRTMLVSDAARGPLMAVIPVLWWTGHLSFAALLIASFAVGAFAAPYFSSARIVIPEVVGENEQLVAQANAIFGAGQQITQIAGPVLAGLLISATSPATVLVVDGATYVFSFLTIALTVRAGKPVDQTPESQGLLAGLRYVMRDPLLGPMLIVASLLNLVAQALVVALNALAYFHYGSAHIAGFLFAGFGVGALLGALLAQQLTAKLPLLKLAAAAIFLMPLPIWLLAISMPWVAATIVAGAFSFFTPLVNAPILGVLTTRTPAALRPKVMTAVMTVALLVGPLGFFGAGLALAHASIYLVFLLIAAAMTACGAAFATILWRGAEAPALVAPELAGTGA